MMQDGGVTFLPGERSSEGSRVQELMRASVSCMRVCLLDMWGEMKEEKLRLCNLQLDMVL